MGEGDWTGQSRGLCGPMKEAPSRVCGRSQEGVSLELSGNGVLWGLPPPLRLCHLEQPLRTPALQPSGCLPFAVGLGLLSQKAQSQVRRPAEHRQHAGTCEPGASRAVCRLARRRRPCRALVSTSSDTGRMWLAHRLGYKETGGVTVAILGPRLWTPRSGPGSCWNCADLAPRGPSQHQSSGWSRLGTL